MPENQDDKLWPNPVRIRTGTFRALNEAVHEQFVLTNRNPAFGDIIEGWRLAAGGIHVANPPPARRTARDQRFHDMLDRILGHGGNELTKAVEVMLRNADAILAGGMKPGEPKESMAGRLRKKQPA